MHDAAPGRYPLHAVGAESIFVTGAVLVHKHAIKDESGSLEAAVRVRAERQAMIVGLWWFSNRKGQADRDGD